MSKFRLAPFLALLLAAFAAAPLRADSMAGNSKAPDSKGDSKPAEPEKKEPKMEEDPPLSVTAHTVTVDGKVLRYHATAGYIILKEEEGKPMVKNAEGPPPAAGEEKAGADKPKDGLKPKAKVFFVAYTLDDVADPAKRPVTYCFNGGPGSASIWLHMGAVSPRRALLTDEGEAPPPPFQLVDNESTWLDRTDLVFIDPVSTGYSRPMPKESAQQFHGLKEDIASVGDFIRLYTSRNTRWLSPKFLLGESYGTTRAAGLSDYLQSRYGLYLNGIILVSSALNFQSIAFSPENATPYIGFLPSYATSAWYHKKLSPEMQAKSVAEVAQEARAFAGGEYTLALLRGDGVSEQDRNHAAAELSRLTGMPAGEFLLLRLRMPDSVFFKRLLFAEGRYLGRYDARFSGVSYTPGDAQADDDYDPSFEAAGPPFIAAFNDYVRRELKFESDIPYESLTDVQPWNFGDAGNGFPNTSEDLRKAMTRNPYLKVWVTCSYFDLATPFFAAESTVASMNLDPAIRSNLRFTYYESGHMLYVHTPSRKKFKADFVSFLADATAQPVVHSAARGDTAR
jgi:carboxypeptidase C (cathepsin A)